MRAHEARHTGQKHILCPECEKSFFALSDLKVHIRIHNGDKPYECHECDKAFSSSGNLRAHMKTHNPSKTYPCPECPKTFTNVRYLQAHIDRHMKKIQTKFSAQQTPGGEKITDLSPYLSKLLDLSIKKTLPQSET